MPDEPIVTEHALARTYDGGHYTDGWTAVEQYRRAVSYAHRNDVGSSATAARLDMPRSRIRPWIDGDAVPEPIRAIDTGLEYGWLECGYGDPVFTGLNALVANVFSGGSIAASTYQLSFALNHLGENASVVDALELANVSYRVVDDRDGRADEVRPTEDGAVLGRVLSVLGAPEGPKADQHLTLPSYLEDAPTDVRETFVCAYLENRAVDHDAKDTLTILEERNRSYLESLAELIESVAGGRVELGEQYIIISADAAHSLGIVR